MLQTLRIPALMEGGGLNQDGAPGGLVEEGPASSDSGGDCGFILTLSSDQVIPRYR